MANKEANIRTCVTCRENKYKNELLRVVKNKNSVIFVDLAGEMDGRSAYICKKQDCILKAEKGKKLERSLKTKIDEEVYKKLKEIIND